MTRPFEGKWDDPFGMDERGAFLQTTEPGLDTTLAGEIRLQHAGRLFDDRCGLVVELNGAARLAPMDTTALPQRDATVVLGSTRLHLRLLDFVPPVSAPDDELVRGLIEGYVRSREVAPMPRLQRLSRPRTDSWHVAAAAAASFPVDGHWEEVLVLLARGAGLKRRAVTLVAEAVGRSEPGLLDEVIRGIRWEAGTA